MSDLYPLRFHPIYRRRIWGGRRLETHLARAIGPRPDYAESWDIVDHGADQSIVRDGPLAGKRLGYLMHQWGKDLLGKWVGNGSFPLLFKFLDANRTLSVQVHPNDEQAARLEPPDLGKTEAWVVVDAEPGSLIYTGLKPGIDRKMLEQAIDEGWTAQCLHSFEPKVGDSVHVAAGTVHALGAGLLIAEIQQASDTTFRLFDWNRTDSEGKPRQLHVEEALDVIDYDAGPVGPQTPQPADRADTERLVECDEFILDRMALNGTTRIGGDGRFHLLTVLAGSIRVQRDPTREHVFKGQSILLPAACGSLKVAPGSPTELLDMYLP